MVVSRSSREIEKMREAGRITANALKLVGDSIEVGINTQYLDEIAENYIRSEGGEPSFLNYVPSGVKGAVPYPATLCVSINEQVVHGIPDKSKIIRDGDVVSIDCGVFKNGYHSDAARTFIAGEPSHKRIRKLVEVTEECLRRAIKEAIVGKRLYDISASVQEYAESFNFGVIENMVGHGIGTKLHEEPPVPNVGRRNTGMFLREGMVIAIEPMINLGECREAIIEEDNWTAVTGDGKPSAHFEHTVVIRENEAEILTMIK